MKKAVKYRQYGLTGEVIRITSHKRQKKNLPNGGMENILL
jgi:hypothetical protein